MGTFKQYVLIVCPLNCDCEQKRGLKFYMSDGAYDFLSKTI